MRDCPAPGGEPLWHVGGDLTNFATTSTRPKNVSTGGSRELPSAMHLPLAPIRLHPAVDLRNRWDVPGSRLLLHVSVELALR
jgi:hypothetical protein